MTDHPTLLSDPVFQLNVLLWAVEDLPESGPITPVLRNAGYYLHAVGRRVIAPNDATVVERLSTLTGTDQTPCRPDLWLKHSTGQTDSLVELKAHGFSTNSSNSRQALKLLASAADLSFSLGARETQPGHVIYATVTDDAPAMSTTLAELRAKLADLDVPVAPAGCIGIFEEVEGVGLDTPRKADLPGPAREALPAVVLRRSGAGNDPRPLYFVPWIPGIHDSQEPDLHADGFRELTARLFTHVIQVVGRAQVPCNLSLAFDELLSDATFGVFTRWRDSDRREFSGAAARIIERALRSFDAARVEGNRVDIDLPSPEVQHAVIERLERADPADPSKNLVGAIAQQPTLFDVS